MSKPIGILVQELRTYIKAELLKFVKEFDVDYWVDFVNNNKTTFAYSSPYREISARVSDYVDPKGRFISFTGNYGGDSWMFTHYTVEEFFEQIVDLLYPKYF